MIPNNSKFSKNNVRASLRMARRGLVAARSGVADTWRVPSERDPHTTYTVTVRMPCAQVETRCTCQAGKRSHGCKHAVLVLQEFNRDLQHVFDLLALEESRKGVAA